MRVQVIDVFNDEECGLRHGAEGLPKQPWHSFCLPDTAGKYQQQECAMVYAQFSKQRSMCRQVVYLVGPEVLGVSDGRDAYGGQQVCAAQAVFW